MKRLKEKDQELQNLYELEIKGYIIRSNADYIEGGEIVEEPGFKNVKNKYLGMSPF